MLAKRNIYFTVISIILGGIVGITFFIFFDFFYSSNLGIRVFNRQNAMGISYPYGWYGLKKNFIGQSTWANNTYTVFTDQYGYRVKNFDEMSRQFNNDAEIIFLGDSFTYGGSSSYEDSYVGLIDTKTKMKIINAGVYSYSPTAYLYQYKEALKLKLLKPGHTVIVAIDVSDIQDEAAFRTDGINHPVNILQAKYEEIDQSSYIRRAWVKLKVFKNNHLVLTSKILEMLRHQYSSFPSPDSEADVYDMPRSAFTWFNWANLNKKNVVINQTSGEGYWPLGVEGGLAKTKSKFHEIVALGKENNAKVYILAYPWPAQIKFRDSFNWSSFLLEICQKASCDGVIDTIPIFRKKALEDSKWYKKYFVPGDIHYSLEGNKVLAESIRKKILRQK